MINWKTSLPIVAISAAVTYYALAQIDSQTIGINNFPIHNEDAVGTDDTVSENPIVHHSEDNKQHYKDVFKEEPVGDRMNKLHEEQDIASLDKASHDLIREADMFLAQNNLAMNSKALSSEQRQASETFNDEIENLQQKLQGAMNEN